MDCTGHVYARDGAFGASKFHNLFCASLLAIDRASPDALEAYRGIAFILDSGDDIIGSDFLSIRGDRASAVRALEPSDRQQLKKATQISFGANSP